MERRLSSGGTASSGERRLSSGGGCRRRGARGNTNMLAEQSLSFAIQDTRTDQPIVPKANWLLWGNGFVVGHSALEHATDPSCFLSNGTGPGRKKILRSSEAQ